VGGLETRGVPVLGVCGFKNSGKTTLLRKLTGSLQGNGLKVGYAKHDAHTFQMDHPGKDTDVLFSSGAEVLCITSSKEGAVRFKGEALPDASIFSECDIILVEGNKNADWDKIWLNRIEAPDESPPPQGRFILKVGAGGDFSHNDVDSIHAFVSDWLSLRMASKPIFGGLLVGGKSTRMGRAKAGLPIGNETFAERQYTLLSKVCSRGYLLGNGPLPTPLKEVERVADTPGIGGPLSGIVSAARFAPHVDWLFLAIDMPNVDEAYLTRLMNARKPGFKCVVSADPDGNLEPLAAVYSSQLLSAIRRSGAGELSLNGLLKNMGIGGDKGLYDPHVMVNVNTPADIGGLQLT
jgi:molybdopterin-guanine dinucleotide biosynthesis protein MobB